MANILTPITLWQNFDIEPDSEARIVSTEESDEVTIERIVISGRKTEKGRVHIAAAYAYDTKSASSATVLILPDSKDTIDEGLLKLFVKRGYSALMVDYRGEWLDCGFYTVYPPDVKYGNVASSGRKYAFVDESADKTCWYEWVIVGLYAGKYATDRNGGNEVAVVGLRDGGEIAWKLGVAGQFKCIIPVCAAGWRAYTGISKYQSVEPELNDERYRFIAGIDSQAYAPYVRCPVLMLCSTNDSEFDYDRAFDTYSRINPDHISESTIAYSVGNGCIGVKCTADMFIYLDKTLKNRQVYIPKPAEVSVEIDEASNLIARAKFDDQGVAEFCGMYFAEDCLDSALREWSLCPPKTKISSREQQFYLNIYEKTTTVFAFCYVKYTNGFTVWSRTAVKKLSGNFRNTQPKCRVLYSDKDGRGTFVCANPAPFAVGGMFLADESAKQYMPHIVEKAKGVKGLSSAGGLTTFRLCNPRYSPMPGNVFKLDIFCEENDEVTIVFEDTATGEKYSDHYRVVGGVWQSIVSESTQFKNPNGVALSAYTSNLKLSILCGCEFAVNNIMWL